MVGFILLSPCLILNFYHFLQIIEKSLTVKEGDKAGFILVKSKLPPRLFCSKTTPQSSCVIHVNAKMQKHREFKCGEWNLPQVVFGTQDEFLEANKCGYMITNQNWHNTLRIPVRATMDGLRDKTQIRKVDLSISIKHNNVTQVKTTLGFVKVSSFL